MTHNWFRICLNIFLNSLFNGSSDPSDQSSDHSDECIGYSEVGSNLVGLVPCLRAPTLDNAVYVFSVSQALFTTARWPPEAEDWLCRVFSCRFSIPFFSFETASPYFIANLFYASFKTTVRLKRISRLIDRHTIRWINAWCLSKWIYSLDALLGIKYC